jgi:hypothetical protein
MKITLNNREGFVVEITTDQHSSTNHVKEAVKLAMYIEGYSKQGIEDIFLTRIINETPTEEKI